MARSVVWITGICIFLLCNGVQAFRRNLESPPSSSPEQLYRTAFHFQPAQNWMNDPNGPMIYKGIYHLFYQYNPRGAVWGNIVWAHSISTDLINWHPLDPAIYPTDHFDINGCWSGSATILPGNKPAIFYTGINTKNEQVQNIAFPKNHTDPFLREWIKPPFNPLMSPTNGLNPSSFRDPTTAWKGQDGRWRILIGSVNGTAGMTVLYRSKDFRNWIRAEQPLHYRVNTEMWECPDFFPVHVSGKEGVDTSVVGSSVKHVLKASALGHDYYTVGKYFPAIDRFIPDDSSEDIGSGGRYDYGKFYASKTFFDGSKKRRILWGWITESDSEGDDIKKGWSGIQAIPRIVWLDSTRNKLVQWPVEELESLREKRVDLEHVELTRGSVIEVSGLTGSQVDIEVSFDLKSLEKAEIFNPSWVDPQLLCSQKGASIEGGIGPIGLLVLASKNLEEHTAVFFRIFQSENHSKHVVLMCSDQSRSSLRTGLDITTYGGFVDVDLGEKKLSLRSLVDHSVVESFGGEGRTCITARVYPQLAVHNDAHLHVFNNGSADVRISKLSAWNMRKARIN